MSNGFQGKEACSTPDLQNSLTNQTHVGDEIEQNLAASGQAVRLVLATTVMG
jgi:hypothetical protein